MNTTMLQNELEWLPKVSGLLDVSVWLSGNISEEVPPPFPPPHPPHPPHPRPPGPPRPDDPHRIYVFLSYFTLIVCGMASVGASLGMLLRIRSFGGRRRRLLLRQLNHLALADLLGSVFFLLNALLPIFAFWMSDGPKSPEVHEMAQASCRSSRWASQCGKEVARLVEVHIALSCLGSAYRCIPLLSLLQWILPAVWFCGIGLATIISFFTDWYWDHRLRCTFRNNYGIWLNTTEITATVIICIVCYAVTVVKVRSTDDLPLAQTRLIHRMRLYIIAGIVTYGPFVLWALLRAAHVDTGTTMFIIASSFLELQGTLNAVVYVLQSHQLRRMNRLMLRDLVAGRRAADLTEDSLQAPLGMPIDDQPGSPAPEAVPGQSRTSTGGQSQSRTSTTGPSWTSTGQPQSQSQSRTSTGGETEAMLVSFTVAFGGVSEISADSCNSSVDSASSTQLLEAAEAAMHAAAVAPPSSDPEGSYSQRADLEYGGDSSLLNSLSSPASPLGAATPGPRSAAVSSSPPALSGSCGDPADDAAPPSFSPEPPRRQPSWREQMERAQRVRAQRQAAIDAWESEQRELQRERCEVQ